MQRREFLAASGAAAFGILAGANVHGAENSDSRALFELRTYHFGSDEKLKAYDHFLANGGVEGLNRAGINPVGVFRVTASDNPDMKLKADANELWVLLPAKDFQTLLTLDDKLAEDGAYQSAGKGILDDPMKTPSYMRYETSLLQAFPGFPQVQVPNKSPNRIMQLRRYESHNRERARKKLEMFNTGGELKIFKDCGMTGVFFGEAIAGPRMPNLTYMLSFENPEAGKDAWGKFGKHPLWNKLKNDSAYNDTVSQITNLFVRPQSASQI